MEMLKRALQTGVPYSGKYGEFRETYSSSSGRTSSKGSKGDLPVHKAPPSWAPQAKARLSDRSSIRSSNRSSTRLSQRRPKRLQTAESDMSEVVEPIPAYSVKAYSAEQASRIAAARRAATSMKAGSLLQRQPGRVFEDSD